MTRTQWLFLFLFFIFYILLGALVFFFIESEEERRKFEEAYPYGKAHTRENVTRPTVEECKEWTQKCEEELFIHFEPKWDFYRSVFFVITVISTIGYGNLSPRSTFGRTFMMFYALFGIPLNGIVMVNLSRVFATQYTKLYKRWKMSKANEDTTHLSLITQIILYLVPGLALFILLPALVMAHFEKWSYSVAVYHSFVTLSTIGFGDFVAGDRKSDREDILYVLYQIFLIVWVIVGLAYILMILSFITRGLASKKMQKLEHKIAQNIKKTPMKIRHELASLLKEFLVLKVKRVYKDEFIYQPRRIARSQSLSDLWQYDDRLNCPTSPLYQYGNKNRRAFSECPRGFNFNQLQKNRSDSDLEHIDKERTFKSTDKYIRQQNLILKVVDAIDNFEQSTAYDLKDEVVPKTHPLTNNVNRRRAISQIESPKISSRKRSVVDFTTRQRRIRTNSEPSSNDPSSSIFTKIKNKITSPLFGPSYNNLEDVESQPIPSSQSRPLIPDIVLTSEEEDSLLEHTSLADLLRALTVITEEPSPLPPKRKLGTAGLPFLSPGTHRQIHGGRKRLPAIIPSNSRSRKASFMPVERMRVDASVRRRRSLSTNYE